MEHGDASRVMDRFQLLSWVASLYYEEELTQAQIASRLHTSRSTVSRLLQEARDKEIVEIIIHPVWRRDRELEKQLVEVFGVVDARVLVEPRLDYRRVLRGLGALAARYLDAVVAPHTILGISWGTALRSTVQALTPAEAVPLTVVQMIGATGARDPLTDGPELARLLADRYGGSYRSLHAPLAVESVSTKEALLKEHHIRETLEMARRADLALVGVGTVIPEYSSWLRAGYIDREGLAELRAVGAVGDICGWHYDVHGDVLDIDLNRCIVGVEPEAFSRIDRVIAVAGGRPKVRSILGALRGGFVDVIITDEEAARGVLGLLKDG